MREDDWFYLHLLAQCQSGDREHRLRALEDLSKEEYMDLVPAQFLLDRLNSTSGEREQSAILSLMGQMKAPLPVDALMTILEDRETSPVFLRMEVAHTLAVRFAEDALDLFLRMVMDPEEDPSLREAMTGDLTLWGVRISDEIVLTLLTDPEPAVSAAALEVLREWPSDAFPLEMVLSFCVHPEGYMREAAIKALRAATLRVPPNPILSALHDPESQVRVAASYNCILLIEWFGDQISLDPIVKALHDEYPPVRENLLDALGKAPHRAPVEPIIAALTDPVHYVQCAAIETLGLMGERVPSSISAVLQEMSGSDPSPHVRQRATHSLLRLAGMQPAPLKFLTVDFTLEDLGE